MANALYGKGRNKFARGEIIWKATGGDSIRAILTDAASYTVLIDTHEFLTDISSLARIAVSNVMTLTDPVLGVCDANDVVFSAVTGASVEAIVLYKDTGVAGTSPLIAYIDIGTGLPVTPNGGDITIQWDNGTNKVLLL